ncbi:DNA primase [Synechococcales cyanobacterium C]|uniref:DNA primase n=1 Tax=Petrachloros mirabilis ULC683 TaxID=2781853 RepID=A0A8K1ZZ32_9CYAN|nr:DNA primase [Petrachloros mirabilis]NCJ06608.1 DNA primase [Petrachloros mirabilis ULC683]
MSLPRIHPDTIEQVRQTADIVDVVSGHVVLRKQGRGFVGCCPFHDDKSPSFSVSPEKQFYYCFGCGAGGNAFKFLMELEKRSFAEVVLDLAQRYQVPVQTLEAEETQKLARQISLREQLYEILAISCRFYEHALRQPGGQAALTYATQSRQLSNATLQQFQIGYAPAGWQNLYDYLVVQKRFPANLVEQAGLIMPRQSSEGYYDRFRDRLMIPIHDLQGRVVGFGSRTLTHEEPKYLNSPETEIFNKGKLLFGLDKARQAIVREDQAVVVEGYFDVIALHAAGITHAVAAMGTALNVEQVKQLLRYTDSKQVILNFDADLAGGRAAERAITEVEALAYQGDVQLRVLNLPNGKDADEFLQEATAASYRQLLAEAPLWLDWQIQRALAGRDLQQADQFQQVTQAIVALLGKLPDATLRTHYIHHCAGLLAQGDGRLSLQLEEALRQQVRGQRWHGRSKKWQHPADYTLQETAEAQLLRIYLHCPSARQLVREALRDRDNLEFSFEHHRFLWHHILTLEEAAAQPQADLPHPELEERPTNLDLITALQDLCTEYSQEFQRIASLLQLDEKTALDILRPRLSIQTAATCIERILCEKRCRHFLNLLESAIATAAQHPSRTVVFRAYLAQTLAQEGDVAPALLAEETQCLQELEELRRLYYEEKRHLQRLDQQRCIRLADLTEVASTQLLPPYNEREALSEQ